MCVCVCVFPCTGRSSSLLSSPPFCPLLSSLRFLTELGAYHWISSGCLPHCPIASRERKRHREREREKQRERERERERRGREEKERKRGGRKRREGELKRLRSNTPPRLGDVLTGRKQPLREEGGRKAGMEGGMEGGGIWRVKTGW